MASNGGDGGESSHDVDDVEIVEQTEPPSEDNTSKEGVASEDTVEGALKLPIGEKRPDFSQWGSPCFSHNYFWKIPNSQIAVCLTCKTLNSKLAKGKVKRKEQFATTGSSTTGLGNHLRSAHSHLTKKFDEQVAEVLKMRNESRMIDMERKEKKMDGMKQLKLIGSKDNKLTTDKPGDDPKLQEKWDNNSVLFCAKTLVPYRAMEHSDILLRTFGRIKVQIKTGATISNHTRKYSTEIRDWIYSIIQAEKDGNNHLVWSFTMDLWSDFDSEPFFGMSTHWCDENFVMRRLIPFVSYFPESHTGVNVRLKLTEFIQKLGLDGPGMRRVVTCDNASENKAALRVLKTNDDEADDYWCFLHTLALCVKDSFVVNLENVVIAQVAKRCQKLAVFIRASKDRRQVLILACVKANIKYHLVKKYVETRWNSKHDTMDSVLRLKEALQWISNQAMYSEWHPFILTPSEFEAAAGAVEVLKPFKVATKCVEGEKTATICEVLPQIYNLHDALNRFCNSDTPYIASFAGVLKENLEDRFPYGGTRRRGLTQRNGVREVGGYQIYSNMAHYLDCRWRGVVLEEYPPALQKTKEEIVKLISPQAGAQGVEQVEAVTEEVDDNLTGMERLAKRRRTSGDSDSGDSSTSARTDQGVMGFMEIEFHAFENMKIECKDNPLFWNSVKTRLPYLAKAAQNVFSVMPSSAPAERVFSVCGRVKHRKRANLNEDSLESLTLINMNQDLIDELRATKEIKKLKMPSVNFGLTTSVTAEADISLDDAEEVEDLDVQEIQADLRETDEED